MLEVKPMTNIDHFVQPAQPLRAVKVQTGTMAHQSPVLLRHSKIQKLLKKQMSNLSDHHVLLKEKIEKLLLEDISHMELNT